MTEQPSPTRSQTIKELASRAHGWTREALPHLTPDTDLTDLVDDLGEVAMRLDISELAGRRVEVDDLQVDARRSIRTIAALVEALKSDSGEHGDGVAEEVSLKQAESQVDPNATAVIAGVVVRADFTGTGSLGLVTLGLGILRMALQSTRRTPPRAD